MTSHTLSEIHISQIRAGDTVQHNGELHTVCPKNLTRSEFMGLALFGDSYKLGTQPVLLVNFNKAKGAVK